MADGLNDMTEKSTCKRFIVLDELEVLYLRYIIYGSRFADQPSCTSSNNFSAFMSSSLTCERFWVEVAEPALQGSLIANPAETLPDTIAQWAADRLDIRAEAESNRLGLLAKIVESDPLRAELANAEAPWSAFGLAAMLRCALRPLEDGPELLSQLEQTARGLTILGAADMGRSDGLCSVDLLSDNASILFALDPNEQHLSPFWRLDFGFRVGDDHANGTLHLIYEDAPQSPVKIALVPRGRSHYAAYVAATGLKTLRWAPADTKGPAVLTMLTARPQLIECVLEEVLKNEGSVVFNHLTKRFGARFDTDKTVLLAELSGFLTRSLGGHAFIERSYKTWIRRHELHGKEAQVEFQTRLIGLSQKPKISVILDLDDEPDAQLTEQRLTETLSALSGQIYQNWELIILERGNVLFKFGRTAVSNSENCIKCLSVPPGADRSNALNLALEKVQGEWLIVLSPGDRLRSDALLAFVRAASLHPVADIVYADGDALDEAGARTAPHFKPDFSPSLLLAMNYIGDSPLLRASTVKKLAAWRSGLGGQLHYDLIWRIVDNSGPHSIVHVPEVLQHERWSPDKDVDAERENQLQAAGIRLLEEHLERTGNRAVVTALSARKFRVRFALPSPQPLVSIIIPTRDQSALLKQCISSILRKSTYKNFEIIIADNESKEAETNILLKNLQNISNVFVIACPGDFNYSQINNAAVKAAHGEVIALINNDTEVITPDWIEEMASWALQADIGCVGAKLFYAEDIIQHAGVVLGVGGFGGHSHRYSTRSDEGYFSRLQVHQDVSAVTAACLFVRRSIFEDVGGLDEIFKVTFNDVDFCLRVREQGFRNVFTPFAELYHYEGQSRGADDTPAKSARFLREIQLMQDRWGDALTTDPYYSPNLTLIKEDFDIRWITD